MNRLLAIRAFKSSRPGGGAGVRRRVRVFLYYHHTPHNFFRHKPPSVPRFPTLAGVTPRAWYRMREAVIEDRSVCVALCSVIYACCRMHKGLSRFYAVTRQAMKVTRATTLPRRNAYKCLLEWYEPEGFHTLYPACRTTSLQRSRNSSSVRSFFARFASVHTIWRLSMDGLPPRATGTIWSYSYSCGLFQESGLPVSAHWKWSPYFACTSL
jgi:hypothetical protein